MRLTIWIALFECNSKVIFNYIPFLWVSSVFISFSTPSYAAAITRNTARMHSPNTWNIRRERHAITLNTLALSIKSTPLVARAMVQTPPEIRDCNSSLKHPDCSWRPHSLLLNRYRSSFVGIKWPGRKINHSLPYSTEIKNEWNHSLLPPYAFVVSTG